MSPSPLPALLRHLNSAPSRTWSLVITIFGDAIVPRGGAVSLATLTEMLRAMGVAEGAARTAMSRLSADGWLQRSRAGRHSFYRLAEKGHETFAAAAARIYAEPPVEATRFRLLLGGEERGPLRLALQQAGFGAVQPGLWLAPLGQPLPPEAAGAIGLSAETSLEDARRLVAQGWPLPALAEAYRQFGTAIAPLSPWLARAPAPLEALVARIALIHAWRRLVLRHPGWPPALLPQDWPGGAARALCGGLYHALLPASEAWLDRHGTCAEGPLPPPGASVAARFPAA